MFGAKYGRLTFWIWSICLLIPDTILITVARVLEDAKIHDKAAFFYVIIFLLELRG